MTRVVYMAVRRSAGLTVFFVSCELSRVSFGFLSFFEVVLDSLGFLDPASVIFLRLSCVFPGVCCFREFSGFLKLF